MEKNSTDNIYKNDKVRYSAKRLRSLIALISFTALLSIVEIYAWFNTQQSVSINNLQGQVQVAEGLQISLDAYSWSQSINLGSATKVDGFVNSVIPDWTSYDAGIGSVTVNDTTLISRNIRPKLLNGTETGYMNPLSTSGTVGSDNRTVKLFSGEFTGTSLDGIRQVNVNELNSENVVKFCNEGYYAFDIYLMNTSESNDKNDQLQLTPNSIVQEIKSSSDFDYGLKNCVRVAFALYEDTAEVQDDKNTIIEKTYNSDISQVAIWEPNADEHSTYVRSQSTKMNEILSNLVSGENAKTYAINQIPETNIINDVYVTNDSSTVLQSTIQTNGDSDEIVDIVDINGSNFTLEPNKISKMRVYVWLEGQDVDCLNWATHSNGINVNIGLSKNNTLNNFAGKSFKSVNETGVYNFFEVTEESVIVEGDIFGSAENVEIPYTLINANSAEFQMSGDFGEGYNEYTGTIKLYDKESGVINVPGLRKFSNNF